MAAHWYRTPWGDATLEGEDEMTKTPLLFVPGLLCSPRLYAAQVPALSYRRGHRPGLRQAPF
jgi:hypothetical protein